MTWESEIDPMVLDYGKAITDFAQSELFDPNAQCLVDKAKALARQLTARLAAADQTDAG